MQVSGSVLEAGFFDDWNNLPTQHISSSKIMLSDALLSKTLWMSMTEQP